jgi:hypothetical protein
LSWGHRNPATNTDYDTLTIEVWTNGARKGDGAETAKLELVGSELVKRAAERAVRREEKLKQLREGQGAGNEPGGEDTK